MKNLFKVLLLSAVAAAAHATPDISGTYDVGTLTPLERPEQFGDALYLTPEQAQAMTDRIQSIKDRDAARSDPNRGAPTGRRVGGYNFFWLDVGSTPTLVDGKFRTSIISRPANGRRPPMNETGQSRLDGLLNAWTIVWRDPDPSVGKNDGTAWWLAEGGGPYDHLEQRPLAERCIIGSRSTAGPPMLPNLYNNHKRIIQTPDHVMILTEMNHDARVIRLGGQHRPEALRTWLGDSVGSWDGDSLKVVTKNFTDTPALSGADRNLVVHETFTSLADGNLSYAFEVHDPTVWDESWGGEYTWQASTGKVYEYACHEGNYALGNIMRGARQLEGAAAGGE